MNDLNKRILDDLGQNFARKLRTTISDTANTCQTADIPSQEIVGMVISAMLYEVVRASLVMGLDEDDFAKMCGIAYQSMVPVLRQEHDQ